MSVFCPLTLSLHFSILAAAPAPSAFRQLLSYHLKGTALFKIFFYPPLFRGIVGNGLYLLTSQCWMAGPLWGGKRNTLAQSYHFPETLYQPLSYEPLSLSLCVCRCSTRSPSCATLNSFNQNYNKKMQYFSKTDVTETTHRRQWCLNVLSDETEGTLIWSEGLRRS